MLYFHIKYKNQYINSLNSFLLNIYLIPFLFECTKGYNFENEIPEIPFILL